MFGLGVVAGFAGAAAVQCGGRRDPATVGVRQTELPDATPELSYVAVSSAAPSAATASSAATALAAATSSAVAPAATKPVDAQPALLRLGHRFTRRYVEQHHAWRLVDGKFWQVEAPPGTPTEAADAAAQCPAGMELAAGEYLLDARGKDTEAVREWQDKSCSKWRGKTRVCEEFDEQKWATLRKKGQRRPMQVCVDRYEYPNQKDEFPLVVVSHGEATALCKKQHKRLCTESEWTFACEGPDALPYPYGYVRSAEKCTIDVTTAALPDDALWPRNSARAVRGIDKAFHATASGAKSGCKSPFGVHDMTGNLDEWTQSTRPGGYASILKGGFWSKVRARCRPQTRAHGPVFVTYETGFRCCSDPGP